MIAAGLLWFQLSSRKRTSADAAPDAKAIAVLPFENMSEDKANAYFADGMQDEIITRLAKIGDLKVISRTSTLPYRTRPEKLSEIARQLGVGHIVEGSVQRIGDRVRVNVQLIEPLKDEHLWAELYDRNLADVFAVQSEIATAIAKALRARLSQREQNAVAGRPTENLTAYDAYLRGLDFFTRPGDTPEDGKAAAAAFEEAVRLDPHFAQAWSALSRANAGIYFLGIDPTPTRKEAARGAAEAANRLAPGTTGTLLANAYYRYHAERDYPGARVLFEQLKEQLPNSSEVYEALAKIARRQSRWADSLRMWEEAAKLNPRDANLYLDHAWTLSALRDYPATEELLNRALAIAPGNPEILINKAYFYETMGNFTAAREILDNMPATANPDAVSDMRINQLTLERQYAAAVRLLEERIAAAESKQSSDNGSDFQLLGWLRAMLGHTEAARDAYGEGKRRLEIQQRDEPRNTWVAVALAFCEAGLGNKEAALRAAERAVSLLPASIDPMRGPTIEENLARVEAQIGELERAISRIERLLSTPYGAFPLTQAVLCIDPIWDPLRSHPRFKAVVEGPEPKTVYH